MAKSKKAILTDVAKLTKAQAKVEHMRLALELEAHNERYYQKDAPTVSDADYDALRQRYKAIEARFPIWSRTESADAEGRRRADTAALPRCGMPCRCCRSAMPSATRR